VAWLRAVCALGMVLPPLLSLICRPLRFLFPGTAACVHSQGCMNKHKSSIPPPFPPFPKVSHSFKASRYAGMCFTPPELTTPPPPHTHSHTHSVPISNAGTGSDSHRPLAARLVVVVAAYGPLHGLALVGGGQHEVHFRQAVAALQAQQLQLHHAGARLEVGYLAHYVQLPVHHLGRKGAVKFGQSDMIERSPVWNLGLV